MFMILLHPGRPPSASLALDQSLGPVYSFRLWLLAVATSCLCPDACSTVVTVLYCKMGVMQVLLE